MKLRTDIQIMRGIAVLVVVLFHLNLNFFANGFLGVDLFFVVSGFLMAVLYKRGHVLDFYLRRASRLMPAYFATIVLTLLFSALITLPAEHVQVAEQGVFGTFFLSNFGFWLTDSYFSSASFKPLLHLWSLGVEVQFYLIVPLLFWMHWRSKLISLAVLLGSLLACLVVVQISPYTAFFITPFRMWQFLAGAAVALYLTDKGTIKHNYPLLGLLGFITLLLLIIFYPVDGTARNFIYGHPSMAAILVTIASALILGFGLPQLFLASKVGLALKKIGDWSYSIYLAHFPVIVLYLYKPFSGTRLEPEGWADILILLALITVFSAIIYNFFDKKRWYVKFSWFPVFILLSLGTVFISNVVVKQGFSEKELNLLSYESDRPAYRCGKIFRLLNPTADYCELTKSSIQDKGRILLIGDSHSDSIKESLLKEAEKQNLRVFFIVDSPPVLGKTKTERILQIADEIEADAVVAHYRYTNALSILESDFIDRVNSKKIKLYWIATTPNFEQRVPEALWQSKEILPIGIQPNDTESAKLVIEKLTSKEINIFDPRPAFCTNNNGTELCRVVSENGTPYYFDSHHLTRTGAQRLEPNFKAWLTQIKENIND